MKIKMIVTAIALAMSGTAYAAAFTNGSFETGTSPGSFTTVGTGQTNITGWNVIAGSVDYIGSYWTASNGARSVDLAGNAPGTLAQTFDTVVGQSYSVSFDLWANNDGGTLPRFAYANVGAGDLTFSSNGGGTRAAPNWTGNSFTFLATGSSTTLSFRADPSSSSRAYGAALDNVSVTAVPEPATWAFMIAGFGLIGGTMRRRKSVLTTA
ncbi:MAG: choice-of-anchor C family protein [Chakrabartia sp.]